jgi:catechol 2,3-dioxygenase-like lactoylglutathione lyase family enzyme
MHRSFPPLDDPDVSLAFYRDFLGFEVRDDVGKGVLSCVTPHGGAHAPRRSA